LGEGDGSGRTLGITSAFATREEEFFEIDAISFERLATLLRQGVEGRLDDVVLIEVGSVAAGVFTLHD
jgi:hypothetical protein